MHVRTFALMLSTLVLGACTDEATDPASPDCAGALYGDPIAATNALHVSAACSSAEGDGAAATPFATIAAAAGAAGPGTTILLAPGTYAESVTLDQGDVHLVGTGADGDDAAVIQPPAGAHGIAIAVEDARETGAIIADLAVVDATGTGILSSGVDLSVRRVEIVGTSATDEAQGHGLQATDGALLEIVSSRITDNAGVGVVTSRVDYIAIIEPSFTEPPHDAEDPAAIIEPSFFDSPMTLASNACGGLAVIDPAPPVGIIEPSFHVDPISIIEPSFSVKLEGADIASNGRYGVALYGAGAVVNATAIRGTVIDTSEFGEGLVIAPPVDGVETPAVRVEASTAIAANEGAGIVATSGALIDVAGEVSFNGYGGVWAQGDGVDVTLSANAVLRDNTLAGVIATLGATLRIDGARVENTRLQACCATGNMTDVGDGIGAFHDARVTVTNATVLDNGRAGILSDAALELRVTGTTISGSETGIAIQQPAATQEVSLADNTVSGNGQDYAEEQPGYDTYPESRCGAGAPSACQPLVPALGDY